MSTADNTPATSGAPTSTSTPPPATPPTSTTPPPTATPPTSTTPPDGGDDRRFTQSDVERIIGERLAREREKFADYDQHKAASAELAQLKAAQMSDTERLQSQLAEANAKQAEADARAAAAIERAQTTLKSASVLAAAARLGAADPNVVLALVDLSKVTVGDDGQVTGADEIVQERLTASPFLVGKPPTPTPGAAEGGVRTSGSPTTFTREQLRDPEFYAANRAAIQSAVAEGRIVG